MLISKEDYEEILEWHYKMEKEETEMLVRPTCAPHYYRVRLQKMKEEGEKFPAPVPHVLHRRRQGVHLRPVDLLHRLEGKRPAVLLLPGVAGNVKKQKFGEIWHTSELFESLRAFEKYKGDAGSANTSTSAAAAGRGPTRSSRIISRRSRSATTFRSRPASAWPTRSRRENPRNNHPRST